MDGFPAAIFSMWTTIKEIIGAFLSAVINKVFVAIIFKDVWVYVRIIFYGALHLGYENRASMKRMVNWSNPMVRYILNKSGALHRWFQIRCFSAALT